MARTRIAACIFIAVLGLFASPVIAQPAKKLTVAEAGRLFLYLPLYYAVEKGYFLKENLNVNVFTAGRRDLAMTSVVAGEAFASVHDPIEAALVRSRGADVKIIAPVVNAAANWLIADRGITDDPKTWRGKTIALSTPPNTQHSIFMQELRRGGWTEIDRTTYRLKGDSGSSDLKILFGAFGADLSLMMSGQANMALMLEPGVSTLVIKANKHVIKDYPKIIGPFLLSTINIKAETIKSDRATVQKFVNALTNAYRDAYRAPQDLASVAGKWFPNTDAAVVQSAIKNMLEAKSFTGDTLFTKAAFQKNVEYFGLGTPGSPALKVQWEDIADTSFAEAASKMKRP
jgi:NitT/TauT family transport system substrate-binding protein